MTNDSYAGHALWTCILGRDNDGYGVWYPISVSRKKLILLLGYVFQDSSMVQLIAVY